MSGLTRPEPHGTDAPGEGEHHALRTALLAAHRLAAFGLAAAGFLPHDPAPLIAPHPGAGPEPEEEDLNPSDGPGPEEETDTPRTPTRTGHHQGDSGPGALKP